MAPTHTCQYHLCAHLFHEFEKEEKTFRRSLYDGAMEFSMPQFLIMYTYKEKLKEITISRLCQTIWLLSKDAASATFTNSLGYMWSLYIENTRWVLIYEPQITVFPFTVAPHGLAPLRRYYVIVNSFKLNIYKRNKIDIIMSNLLTT